MKIFTQYINTKFVHSLSDISGNIQTASGIIDNRLYDIHHKYNFDVYIFCANMFNSEVHQFLQDYIGEKKIIFYHYKIINENILNISDKITHISHIQHEKCVTIPFAVNDHVFKNTHISERNNDIICFLDGYYELPKDLHDLVYPNVKYNLKLFSSTLEHKQNFGFLSEKEKAKMLNISKNYLDIDNLYRLEANLCGANILTIDELSQELALSTQTIDNYTTYLDFIESITNE